MILTEDQILELVKKPKNAELIKRACHLLCGHQLHIKGVGIEDFISKVQDYENDQQLENRKKTTKASTVPIFGKELSVFSKIFSAQGTSRYYDIGGEDTNLEVDFKNYMNDVGEGRSMFQWMKDVWLDKVNYDSTGVLMAEIPKDISIGRPEPYLVFRSVREFHDLDFIGKKLEYIIFCESKTDKSGKYMEYRVIDDAFDYIVIEKDGNYSFERDSIIKNQWGYVPAIFCSNQKDAISEAMTSYVWKSIGIADEYLTDSSIHSVLKKLHGYPIFWMRQRGCRSCKGTGRYTHTDSIGKSALIACNDCKGTGYTTKKDVSDGIIIPQLTDPNQVDSLPVAGYEQPDLGTLKDQREEMDWLKSAIHIGIWGDDSLTTNQSTSDQTATGRILDVQAIYDKLNLVSENAESVELFLTNAIGQIRYGALYRGASINYGRRYFVRSAFEIEELYAKAKNAGLPNNVLSSYREELVHVKFANDAVQLNRQLKLMELEPFQDYSTEQVRNMGVLQEDLFMKIYFNEYILKYEREVKPILLSDVEEIKLKLLEYNSEKISKVPKPQEPQIIAA